MHAASSSTADADAQAEAHVRVVVVVVVSGTASGAEHAGADNHRAGQTGQMVGTAQMEVVNALFFWGRGGTFISAWRLR